MKDEQPKGIQQQQQNHDQKPPVPPYNNYQQAVPVAAAYNNNNNNNNDNDNSNYQQNYEYGTFQGVVNYQQNPVTGFPQPVPPPAHHPYTHGYHAVSGYAVVEGTPAHLHRLPCCGIGFGWFLFIVGFFFGALPWYIGAIILFCVRSDDHREQPGYIACTIAAVLVTFAVMIGASSGPGWH